ncbi:MAG: hypothetical protein MMC23_005079 [Stictis urceolatum]|nr:hypothetical protein [Stictis urceolata]
MKSILKKKANEPIDYSDLPTPSDYDMLLLRAEINQRKQEEAEIKQRKLEEELAAAVAQPISAEESEGKKGGSMRKAAKKVFKGVGKMYKKMAYQKIAGK